MPKQPRSLPDRLAEYMKRCRSLSCLHGHRQLPTFSLSLVQRPRVRVDSYGRCSPSVTKSRSQWPALRHPPGGRALLPGYLRVLHTDHVGPSQTDTDGEGDWVLFRPDDEAQLSQLPSKGANSDLRRFPEAEKSTTNAAVPPTDVGHAPDQDSNVLFQPVRLDDVAECEADDQDDVSDPADVRVETRESFYSHLRFLLLEDRPDAATIATFLKTSSWWAHHRNFRQLLPSEKSLMSEAFHVILRYGFLSSSAVAMTPSKLVKAYMSRRLLDQAAWVRCLVSASTLVNGRLSQAPTGTLQQKAWQVFETHRQLHFLALLWQQFFAYHQDSGDAPSLDPRALLDHPAADASNSLDYATRFLTFVPRWVRNEQDPSDQLVICSSLLTLEAVSFWVQHASFLVPPKAGTGPYDPDGSAGALVSRSWSTLATDYLSSTEAGLLFVVACAADSSSVNAVLLRLALAKMALPAERAQPLARTLQELQHTGTSDRAAGRSRLRDRIKYHLTPFVRDGINRPVSWIVLGIQRSKSPDVLREWNAFYRALSAKNSTASTSLVQIARALCQAFWDLGVATQALEIWRRHEDLHRSSRLFLKAIRYYDHQRDVAGLEQTWQLCARHMTSIPASVWQRRLNLLYAKEMLAEFDAACVDMIARTDSRRVISYDVTKGFHRTSEFRIGNFNYNLQRYLDAGIHHRARYLLGLLRETRGVEPNKGTIRILASDALRRGHADDFREWVTVGRKLGLGISHDTCTTMLVMDLQSWPCSAEWVKRPIIFDAITRALSLTLGDPSVYRPADATDQPCRINSLASPTASQLSSHAHTIPGLGSNASPADLMREWRLSIKEAYLSFLEAIIREFPRPRNVRLVCFLHDHYTVLAGTAAEYLNDLATFTTLCTDFLDTLPRSIQLSLLKGDLYKPAHERQSPPKNFSLVRTTWGMPFITRDLMAKGCPDYRAQLHKIPWTGFAAFGRQTLRAVGITRREEINRIILHVSYLQRDGAKAREITEAGAGGGGEGLDGSTSQDADSSPDREAVDALLQRISLARQRTAMVKDISFGQIEKATSEASGG